MGERERGREREREKSRLNYALLVSKCSSQLSEKSKSFFALLLSFANEHLCRVVELYRSSPETSDTRLPTELEKSGEMKRARWEEKQRVTERKRVKEIE